MMKRNPLMEKVREGRKLLIPYLCAGHPSPEATVDVLEALAQAGADALELGIPFSDPLADGGVVQAASAEALRKGMTLARVLAMAEAYQARGTGVPLFLMGYVNPLLAMGPEAFVARAQAAGVQGLLVPDLPLEAQGLLPGMDLVQFAAPNTDGARLEQLLAAAPPFLYAVSVLGVTGVRQASEAYTHAYLARVQAQAAGRVPVVAGFGVGTPQRARELSGLVDGVVVGSALLTALDGVPDREAPGRAAAFLAPFRHALDDRG